MTPLQFEALHRDQWAQFSDLLKSAQTSGRRLIEARRQGELIAQHYAQCCEQLALARTRGYPAYLVDLLERLTAEAHQLIYRRREWGVGRLRLLVLYDFPRQVRRLGVQLWIAAAAFVLPMLVVGWLVYHDPELVNVVFPSSTVGDLDRMYSPSAESLGRVRTATTDWSMFGWYIRNNIGIAFQCFAAGIFLGFGSLFFLAFNGVFAGAAAGYLTARGMSGTFYPFVVTHSAFELTAIVLAGAAGLRIGGALLAPGRMTRHYALVVAGRHAVVVMYGVTAMLLIAAALEAFWSSSVWLPVAVKFAVAALCWLAVFSYLARQGHHAD